MRIVFFFCLILMPFAAQAQSLTELGMVAAAESQVPVPPVVATQPNAVAPQNVPATLQPIQPEIVKGKSLFFTPVELAAIHQAKKGYIAPSENAIVQAAPIDPGPRYLKLSGIVYNGENDWVIWFNGERVHPKNLPQNMKDLIVRKDRIALRWLDKGTNKIISLVLRPHQQYHIDSDTISMGTE